MDLKALKGKECLWAFLAAVLVAAAGFAAVGVYPFGRYAVVCSDMEQQFLDLTAGIFNNLKSGKSLFISFSGGMGINLFAWSSYILFDPFNILFLFFDVEYYQEVYLVIDILKYGLIALCASTYFKKSNYTGLSGSMNIALAVLYAFGSFCLKSVINVMWLVNVAMLPIVLLAIERVIEKRKADMLFFAFLYCTASNFYLAFATGAFAFMYFIFYYINCAENKKTADIIKSVFICAFTVLLVGGICMFFIIPAWANISGSYGEMFETDFFGKLIEWKPISIAQAFTMIQPTSAVDSVIHGFFGILPLFASVMFFFEARISKKEKISAFVWIVFMLCSLMIRPIYLVWHIFREPTGFYGRFIYVAAFMFIMLTARSIAVFDLKRRRVLLWPPLLVFLTAFFAVSDKTNFAVLINLCVDTVFLVIYFVLFAAYAKRRSVGLIRAAAAAVVLEALFMTVYGLNVSKRYDNWVERSVYYNDIKKTGRLMKNIDDDSFYRVTNLNRRSLNSAFSLGYNALEVFSSFTNQRSLNGLALLGLYSPYDYRSVDNFFNNVVTDGLLDNKYLLVTKKDEMYPDGTGRVIPAFIGTYTAAFRLTAPCYEKIAETDDGIIYKNDLSFPLMFKCSEKARDADTRYFDREDKLLACYMSEGVLLNSLFDTDKELYTECSLPSPNGVYAEITENEKDSDFIRITPTNLPAGQIYANEGYEVGYAIYEYPIEETGEYCVDIREFYKNSDMTQMRYHTNINGFNLMTYHMPNCQFETSDLGWFEKGDTLTLRIETQRVLDMAKPALARLDMDAFKEFSKKANENALSDIRQQGGDITAVSDFDERSLVFSSLSYDEGFHVFVDGAETEKLRIADGFLGYYVPEGRHNIRIIYVSPGFEKGMAVSAISCVLALVWLILNGKRKPASENTIKKEVSKNEEI